MTEEPFGHHVKQWDQDDSRVDELLFEAGFDFVGVGDFVALCEKGGDQDAD